MKVRLGEGRSFFYPDVVITCDERDDPTQAYIDLILSYTIVRIRTLKWRL